MVGRMLSTTIPPFTLSFSRMLISFLILLPIMVPVFRKEWELVKKQWKWLLLLAITGVIGFNVLTYQAAHFTTAINITLVNGASPVIMVLLAYWIMGEKGSLRLYFAVVLSIAGLLWVMTQGSLELLRHLQFNPGDLLMLLAIFMWAVYSVYLKKVTGLGPLSVLFFGTLVGCVLLLPVTIGELAVREAGPIGVREVAGMLFLGIFPSIVSLVCWNRAVELIGPSRCSLFQNLVPVWGAVMAFLMLGESITIAHLVGALLVFAGVLLSRSRPQARTLAQPDYAVNERK